MGQDGNIDLDCRARCNAECRFPRIELVAANVVTSHVADKAIVLPVLGLANSTPGLVAIDYRESIFMITISESKCKKSNIRTYNGR
jgi:hypothetical protein